MASLPRYLQSAVSDQVISLEQANASLREQSQDIELAVIAHDRLAVADPGIDRDAFQELVHADKIPEPSVWEKPKFRSAG